MPLPQPQLGLVLSYSYVWHNEHRAGRREGTKHRPCVVVLAVWTEADDMTRVRVAPITHRPPANPAAAFELPPAVKRHLALDSELSWVVIDEVNEFVWPGYDLRTVPGSKDSFAYGFLPPRLFTALMTKLQAVWNPGHGKMASRDCERPVFVRSSQLTARAACPLLDNSVRHRVAACG